MKFNCDKDQVQIVDNDTDVVRVMKNITESGMQEDAFYVFDARNIIQKYDNWKEKLPRVIPYYAVKCNDHAFVLKILSSLGIGFDCASKEEIRKILSLGVDPSRIIFANPAKVSSHLRYAFNVGVEFTTVDNENELYKIKKLLPNAKILIRIRCDASVAQCPLGMKYGCNSVTEAPSLLQMAVSMQLEVVGICFHVGSGCGEPIAYKRAIATARTLFEFGNTLGFNMQVLDIGGGFPGNKDTSIDTIAEIVNDALDEYFPIESNVTVIAEPGRYFVASAFTLATFVHSKRVVRNSINGSPSNMYYINDGIYGSFNSLLYDHAEVQPLPLSDVQARETVPCSIWGPTCDSLDMIIDNITFPNMNIGDWIMFENMGAYTFTAASSFNGFAVPKVYAILNESTMVLLKESLETMEEEFEFENTTHTEMASYLNNWKENQQIRRIYPDIINLKKKLAMIST